MLTKLDHGGTKNNVFIINPKFQLSIISGCRNIADFKMCKITTKTLQTRIWVYYIFLDFYATELKLPEIEE